MRKLVALLTCTGLVTLAVSAASFAGTQAGGWSAKLTPTQVAPAQKAKNGSANGSFSGTVSGYHLKFKLDFSKLTGPATSAYIGYGKAGKAGNVSVNLCAPCTSPVTTTVDLNPSLKKLVAQHLLYIQVTTGKNPNGEIRGQLSG